MDRKMIWTLEIITAVLCVPFFMWCLKAGSCNLEPVLALAGGALLIVLGTALFFAERYACRKDKHK